MGSVVTLRTTPNTVNGTVTENAPPIRRKNAESQEPRVSTPGEVELLVKTARGNRHGLRDLMAIRMAARHGLRVTELVGLEWSQVDLQHQMLHVKRLKNGQDSPHPLDGDELRALRQMRRDDPHGRFVFLSERAGPLSAAGLRKMLARLGADAGFDFLVHPHQLRHACGYQRANEGKNTRDLQLWLGHRNIQHTVRYTMLDAGRFNGW